MANRKHKVKKFKRRSKRSNQLKKISKVHKKKHKSKNKSHYPQDIKKLFVDYKTLTITGIFILIIILLIILFYKLNTTSKNVLNGTINGKNYNLNEKYNFQKIYRIIELSKKDYEDIFEDKVLFNIHEKYGIKEINFSIIQKEYNNYVEVMFEKFKVLQFEYFKIGAKDIKLEINKNENTFNIRLSQINPKSIFLISNELPNITIEIEFTNPFNDSLNYKVFPNKYVIMYSTKNYMVWGSADPFKIQGFSKNEDSEKSNQLTTTQVFLINKSGVYEKNHNEYSLGLLFRSGLFMAWMYYSLYKERILKNLENYGLNQYKDEIINKTQALNIKIYNSYINSSIKDPILNQFLYLRMLIVLQ